MEKTEKFLVCKINRFLSLGAELLQNYTLSIDLYSSTWLDYMYEQMVM